MNRLFRSIVTISLFALVAGCASAPTNSGYLSDYGRLQAGGSLEKYWFDASRARKTESPSILLSDISTDMISDKKGVSVSDSISWLQSGLENAGLISSDSRNASLKIEVAITFLDPGSAAKRVLAGELGAGHANVQVEGKVFDIENGDLVAAFAERRSSSGAIGLKDIGGDAGPGLIEQMIKLVTDDINSELEHTFSLKVSQ